LSLLNRLLTVIQTLSGTPVQRLRWNLPRSAEADCSSDAEHDYHCSVNWTIRENNRLCSLQRRVFWNLIWWYILHKVNRSYHCLGILDIWRVLFIGKCLWHKILPSINIGMEKIKKNHLKWCYCIACWCPGGRLWNISGVATW
jgi:hypothetical protein